MTGRERTYDELMDNLATGSLSEELSQYPEESKAFISKMLAIDVTQRYQSAGDALQDPWLLQGNVQVFQDALLDHHYSQHRTSIQSAKRLQSWLLERTDVGSTFESPVEVLESINDWIDHSQDSNRILLITGTTGSGKSTILGNLIRNFSTKETILLHYSCSHGDPESLDPFMFLHCVLEQLESVPQIRIFIEKHYSAVKMLLFSRLSPPKQIFILLFTMLKDNKLVFPFSRCLLMVDAIDESLFCGDSVISIAAMIKSCFKESPRWMRFVFTSRPERLSHTATSWLATSECRRIDLDMTDTIHRFLSRNLHIQTLSSTLDILTLQCNKSLHYARTLLDEFRDPETGSIDVLKLPQNGLYGLYSLRIGKNQAEFELLRPLFEIVSSAPNTMTVDEALSAALLDASTKSKGMFGSFFSQNGDLIIYNHESVYEFFEDFEEGNLKKMGYKRLVVWHLRRLTSALQSMTSCNFSVLERVIKALKLLPSNEIITPELLSYDVPSIAYFTCCEELIDMFKYLSLYFLSDKEYATSIFINIIQNLCPEIWTCLLKEGTVASELLFQASCQNIPQLVSVSLSREGVLPNYKGWRIGATKGSCYRMTSLFAAASNGLTDIVAKILTAGLPDLDVSEGREDMGESPISVAARGNHVECIRLIVNSGYPVDINHHSKRGQTALHMAVLNRSRDCFFYLLSLPGINIDCFDEFIATKYVEFNLSLNKPAQPFPEQNEHGKFDDIELVCKQCKQVFVVSSEDFENMVTRRINRTLPESCVHCRRRSHTPLHMVCSYYSLLNINYHLSCFFFLFYF
jgi:energy-coupling factor transporter ATP-binding protein EcfA2